MHNDTVMTGFSSVQFRVTQHRVTEQIQRIYRTRDIRKFEPVALYSEEPVSPSRWEETNLSEGGWSELVKTVVAFCRICPL